MKYAKLINGVLTFPPRNKDNVINYFLNSEMLIEDGYKPLIEAIKPEGHYKATYTEEENQIVETWVDCTEEIFLAKKTELLEENTQKAKQAVENGYVVYKEAQFETNAQTVGDLTATMLMLQAQQNALNNNSHTEASVEVSQNEEDSSVASLPQNDNKTVILNPTIFEGEESETDISALPQYDELTYTWLSKDDKAVELTIEDFSTLGNLIAAYKNNIWSNKYIAFKTAIEQAETLEELEEIEINYS